MSLFDDYDPQLNASASPGLATLPATDTQPPAPVEDLSREASLGLAAPPKATSGLGLADFKSARSEDDKAYLQNLPTAQKIGLMLQAFGAGVNGGPNPIDTMLAQKQKREAEFRAELGTTINTLKQVMPLVKAMPPGKEREAFIEQVVRVAGGHGSEVKTVLQAMGTAQEDEMKNVVSVLENPHAQAHLVKLSGGDPEKARKLLQDDGTIKLITQTADRKTLPTALGKLSVISEAMKKMPEFKEGFSMSDVRTQNAQLPPQFQLTDAEMGALDRNQASGVVYGMKTDKTLQDEQSAEERRGPQSDVGKARADLAAGRITQADFDKMMKSKDQRIVLQDQRIEKGAAAPTHAVLSPDAIEDAAYRYNLDGTLPPNLGRGTQGSINSAKILTRAAELAREQGDSGEATRITQIANKANSGALLQLEKQRNLIVAFEKNAVRNAEIVIEKSEKVGRLGVPAIDRWIQAGQKKIAGDVEVAELDTAVRTFVNEYARVTTSVTGGGITSDTARKEIEALLQGAMTKEQVRGVVDLMKREMRNREAAYAEQAAELKGRMTRRKDDKPPEQKTETAALPLPKSKAELVKGKKYQTARGVATWNGTAFEQ